MPVTSSQFADMLARTQKNTLRSPDAGDAVERESKLHDVIIDWANRQWPRVKFIRARMDKRSTIAIGSQDFTLFLPKGRTLCVELKAKGGKPTREQLIWHKEMEMLGHKVHVVYCFDEFLKVIST
jgi:hypothetical protein